MLFSFRGKAAVDTLSERRRRILTRAAVPCIDVLEDRTLFSFVAPVSYAVGAGPHGTAVADFNADGHADLAVANISSGSVSVLLGNGDGTFQPASNYAAGASAYDVAAADMNGDGVSDLVVADDVISGSVTVLLGNGDGTFAAPVSFAAGPFPHSLAVGDFNGDGHNDVAAADNGGTALLLGNGDGTLRPMTALSTGVANNLVARDFNHDGALDLVEPNTVSFGTVNVLLGNNDGTFQPARTYYAGSAPTEVAVGDFDGDGNLDLALPNSYTSSSITILHGNGDGSFGAPTIYNVGTLPFDVQVADFNGDGVEDLAERGSSTYAIQFGKGDGTFYPQTNYAAPVGPNGTGAVGDFNGDGSPDLVAPTSFGTIAILTNAANDQAALGGAVGFQVAMPSTAMVGAALPITVTAVDAAGNPVPNFTGTVYLDSSDPQMRTPASAYTFAAADAGTHTFLRGEVLGTLGTQMVTVSAPFMTTSSTPVLVTPAATRFAVSAPASAVAGDTINITVTAQDALGNTAVGYVGSLTFGSNDLQALLPAGYTLTAADAGTHTFSVTLKTAGTPYIYVQDPATGLNGTSYTTVSPAAATALTIAGGGGSIGVSRPITVSAVDPYGNVASSYSSTVQLSSSDAAAVMPATANLVNGRAVVNMTLMTVGTQTITATDPSFTVTETLLDTPAVPSVFSFNGATSAVAGTAQNFTITVLDTIGQVATGYTGTVYFSSSDVQAGLPAAYTFTAADAGVHTFTGTFKTAGAQSLSAYDYAGGVYGAQSGVQVVPGAVASFSVSGFTAAVAGTAQNFTVTARDAYGNLATNYTGTVNFTSTDAQASLPAGYTFTAADGGIHSFTATLKSAGGQSVTVADSVNAAALGTQADINIAASSVTHFGLNLPAKVTAGTAFLAKLSALDAFGNVVTGYAGTVHFSTNAAGATLPADYTFGTADKGVHSFSVLLTGSGNQTLTATDLTNSLITGSATTSVGTSGGGGGGTTSTGGGGTATGGGTSTGGGTATGGGGTATGGGGTSTGGGKTTSGGGKTVVA